MSDLSSFIVMVGGTVAIVFVTALVFRAFNSARTRMSPDVRHAGRNRTRVAEDVTGLKVLYDPIGETPPEVEYEIPLPPKAWPRAEL